MVPDTTQPSVTTTRTEAKPLIIKRIDAIPIAIPLKKPVIMAGVRLEVSYNLLVRAEAANGDPWVLRRIGAVLHLHAGYAKQQVADTTPPQRRAVVDRGARPGEGQFER